MIVLEILIYCVFGSIALIALWRLFRFLSTPVLRAIGYYKYYSPTCFLQPLGKHTYDIHMGSSWDFFKLQLSNPRMVIRLLAEGMFGIACDVERGAFNPKAKFKGCVYYFNTTTISRFGFTYRRLKPFEKFMFSLNYLELCLLYSLTRKRPSLVRLNNLRIITITPSNLVRHKEHYADLARKIGSSYSNEDEDAIKESRSTTVST